MAGGESEVSEETSAKGLLVGVSVEGGLGGRGVDTSGRQLGISSSLPWYLVAILSMFLYL